MTTEYTTVMLVFKLDNMGSRDMLEMFTFSVFSFMVAAMDTEITNFALLSGSLPAKSPMMTCIWESLHVYVCMHIHVCKYVCKFGYICTYIRLFVCKYGCMHVCIYVSMYVWLYECMYVCIIR